MDPDRPALGGRQRRQELGSAARAPGRGGDGLRTAQAALRVIGKTFALLGVTKREVGVAAQCAVGCSVWV